MLSRGASARARAAARASALALGLLTGAAALASGCSSRGAVERENLSPSPIAMLLRPEEEALDRLDALRDWEQRTQGTDRPGIARLENLDGLYGGEPELQERLRGYQGRIALLDPRTGKAEVIPNAPPGAQPLAWSPDRRRLLVNGRWRDQLQLFVWDRELGQFDIVTSGPHGHAAGCLTSDGRIVAVESDDPTNRRSWLVASPPGGGGLRRITDGPAHYRPACSPTDPRIAFVDIDETGRRQIMVLDLEPLGEPRAVALGIHPVFTPDGEWIVYAAPTTAGSRLFRVRYDGVGRTPLSRSHQEELSPAVSPDGRHVVYVVVGFDKRERLWVRRYDGTGDRPLLKSGDGAMPAW